MKVVLLTNILSPYRKVFYDKLFACFREKGVEFVALVMAETEPNRPWHYSEYKGDYCELLNSKTRIAKNIYFHFNNNLQKRLQEIRPDIVIASGSYISPSVLKVIRLKNKLNYKLLFWSESHLNELRSYGYLKLKIRELIRNMIYKRFDGFWYAGIKSKEFIEKYADKNIKAKKKKKYYFIPNLVDHNFYYESSKANILEKAKIKADLNIPIQSYVFILPARLEVEKGILPFFKLFNACYCKNKATIIILGDGKLRSDIEQYGNENQLDIKLMGYVKQEDIQRFYSIADCFLLPSLSDPNPLSCIEALWSGLPLLLTTHVGNYPETIKIGQNGYVINYDDSKEAISIIDNLISSDEDWKASAKNISLAIAEEIYEPDKAVRQLVNSMVTDYGNKYQ